MKRLVICALAILIVACGASQPSKPGGASKGKGIASLTPAERSSFDQAVEWLEAGESKKAASQLQLLAGVQADVIEVWLNLALAQYQQGQLEQANASLKNVFSRSTNVAQAHNLAGLVAVTLGQFEQAKTHYSKAIELAPQYSQALYNMALLHDVYFQDVPTAVSFYERYVALKQDDTQTQDWLAHLKRSL